MLKIEKGIPIPSKFPTGKASFWGEMEVGDSVFFPGETIKRISSRITYVTQQTGFKFTCRTIEGGVRVWRIQ